MYEVFFIVFGVWKVFMKFQGLQYILGLLSFDISYYRYFMNLQRNIQNIRFKGIIIYISIQQFKYFCDVELRCGGIVNKYCELFEFSFVIRWRGGK